jgi:SAM-dependent methyltransferase
MAFGRVARELRRIRSQLRKTALGMRLGRRWGEDENALSRRSYPDYETYLEHQSLKLDALRASSIAGHEERFAAALGERLAALPLELAGRSVLCLAARTGAEVRAFVARGAFAVGIDLNPGARNRWVVEGDFHRLQFADASVDVVYVNSLDHVFDLERVLAEVSRVLKPDGVLIAEVGMGREEGNAPGFYEALSWRTAEELIARIVDVGFTAERRSPFDLPWKGVQALLRKRA